MSSESPDFKRFVESFFGTGPMAAREEPDEAALLRLKDEERARAEAMLLERLGPGDSRPAVGLGALRAKSALAPLKARLLAESGKIHDIDAIGSLNTAVALWRINQSPDALDHVCRVLAHSPHTTVRTRAAVLLRYFRVPKAVNALEQALRSDDQPLVRHNAAKSLLWMHGLLASETETPPLSTRVMIKAPAVREEAIKELFAQLSSHPLVKE